MHRNLVLSGFLLVFVFPLMAQNAEDVVYTGNANTSLLGYRLSDYSTDDWMVTVSSTDMLGNKAFQLVCNGDIFAEASAGNYGFLPGGNAFWSKRNESNQTFLYINHTMLGEYDRYLVSNDGLKLALEHKGRLTEYSNVGKPLASMNIPSAGIKTMRYSSSAKHIVATDDTNVYLDGKPSRPFQQVLDAFLSDDESRMFIVYKENGKVNVMINGVVAFASPVTGNLIKFAANHDGTVWICAIDNEANQLLYRNGQEIGRMSTTFVNIRFDESYARLTNSYYDVFLTEGSVISIEKQNYYAKRSNSVHYPGYNLGTYGYLNPGESYYSYSIEEYPLTGSGSKKISDFYPRLYASYSLKDLNYDGKYRYVYMVPQSPFSPDYAIYQNDNLIREHVKDGSVFKKKNIVFVKVNDSKTNSYSLIVDKKEVYSTSGDLVSLNVLDNGKDVVLLNLKDKELKKAVIHLP